LCFNELVLIRTTYLEQLSPEQVRPGRPPREPVQVVRVERTAPEFARFLYSTVGGDWYWRDRLGWSREEWVAHLERPLIELWVAWAHGAPAGYFELSGSSTMDFPSVEIAYFGLLPGFLGVGLGGHLLTVALRSAWTLHSRWRDVAPVGRVWVHTCTLDGPAALANYEARGLAVYRTEEAEEDVPDSPPGSWPAMT
jgi:GNAT superfamily N-acetyltransferase